MANDTESDGRDPKNSDEVAESRADIYYRMLIQAMKTLELNGIKYVEYSYSTRSAIERMYQRLKDYGYTVEGIDFKLLFSLSRATSDEKKINRFFDDLDDLLRAGIAKGFDLMGEESGLTREDVRGIDVPTSFISVVYQALVRLGRYPGTVLRLHAGENRESRYNPLWSLRVIDAIASEHRPFEYMPEIRLGHGLHFFKDYTPEQLEEYRILLKKYRVVVEINATSNYSLGNIKDIEDIPYDWYISNHIPIVLATDGAGMYLTTAKQEKMIADAVVGPTDRVIERSESRYMR